MLAVIAVMQQYYAIPFAKMNQNRTKRWSSACRLKRFPPACGRDWQGCRLCHVALLQGSFHTHFTHAGGSWVRGAVFHLLQRQDAGLKCRGAFSAGGSMSSFCFPCTSLSISTQHLFFSLAHGVVDHCVDRIFVWSLCWWDYHTQIDIQIDIQIDMI